MTSRHMDKYERTADEELTFAEELAMAQAAIAVASMLDTTSTTQRTLADRTGVSEARISQVLRADSNPTVRTMARIGHAMGRRLVIEFEGQPTREKPEESNERASIEAFVESTMRLARPKGTNAAVTGVVLAVARAAANMATRDKTGAIDPEEAGRILRSAMRLMGVIR